MKVELEVDFILVLLHSSNAQLGSLRGRWHIYAIKLAVETIVGIVRGRIAIPQMKVAVKQRGGPVVLDALPHRVKARIETIVLNVLHRIGHEDHGIGS